MASVEPLKEEPRDMRIALEANGPEISRIVLGMMRLGDWKMSTAELRGWIERTLELGITAFDHADIYGDGACEAIFGEALAGIPSARGRMQIITKCGIKLASKSDPGCAIKRYDASKPHIIASVENSLRRLRTDRIDLLLIHRPDPLMDPDEVAEAFSSGFSPGLPLFEPWPTASWRIRWPPPASPLRSNWPFAP